MVKHNYTIYVVLVLFLARNVWGQEPTTKVPVQVDASTTATAKSPGITTNDYALPEVGTLHLAVPQSWQASFKKTIVMGTRADEVHFQPREGNDYAAMVVAVHMTPASARDFNTREVLMEAAKSELPGAVEKTADIHDLTGPEVSGNYFSLTDGKISADKPKPGEYKYLTVGYAKLGDLVLILRVVSNRNGEEKAQALEMIRMARLTPAP